jgi:hypothetical protein
MASSFDSPEDLRNGPLGEKTHDLVGDVMSPALGTAGRSACYSNEAYIE